MTARLWIDVEDLLRYAPIYRRPSGIQRLAFEIYRTLQEQYGATGLVQFVRYNSVRADYHVVPWRLLEMLFAGLTESETASPGLVQGRPTARPPVRRTVRNLLGRLSPSMRVAANDALIGQIESWRAWRRLAGAVWRAAQQTATSTVTRVRRSGHGRRLRKIEGQSASGDQLLVCAKPGDVLISLGAAWWHPDYAGLIRLQRERGLRFALLVYDLIPIRHPEWCARGHVQVFSNWMNSILPLCDTVFAISQTIAADVEDYACEQQIALPGPVVPIPIGSGFGGAQHDSSTRSLRRQLPAPGSYALFVSTIEARKNHALLFRVWQRLLHDLPAERVPTLVFAGRIGWLVDDLLRQISNTSYLEGKLLIIENPTDDELSTLYRDCLFTLFPSFYEGWGLPVTESLALGKPCVIANCSALPEAGGGLVRSFDPDNLHDAYRVIRAVIDDRPALARWEAEVRREFRPVPWSATVAALVSALQLHWRSERSQKSDCASYTVGDRVVPATTER